jgi:integrase
MATITDPKKIGELLRAIDGYEGTPVAKCALKLAPLVFVRPGELRHAEWAEIDLDKAEWRIPAEKMKMKNPHIVPLSSQAVKVLCEIFPITGQGQYVFPSVRTNSRPMSENTILAALRRMGYTKEEMSGHGFRAMASTVLHEQNWPSDVIERQLAHAERNSIKAAYNHAQHLPERRKMMQAWADYLDALKSRGKIVPIFKTAEGE